MIIIINNNHQLLLQKTKDLHIIFTQNKTNNSAITKNMLAIHSFKARYRKQNITNHHSALFYYCFHPIEPLIVNQSVSE